LQQHDAEQHIAAGKLQPREGERRQRAQHELHRQDQCHQHERVEQIAREWCCSPGAGEVFQGQRREEIKPRGVGRRMERRPHRVEQRQQPQNPQHPGADRFQDPIRAIDHR
jgi:hypothetical protein